MRHASPKQYFAATHRAVAASAIEWEELPSLAGTLAQRLMPRGSAVLRSPAAERGANDSGFDGSSRFSAHSQWDNTAPAALDPASVSMPFREALEGLATREVTEPDVFQHFFGQPREEV